MRAYGVSADNHAFDNAVGIAFHETSIHVGSGVTLISVGDDIFRKALRLAHPFPLDSGRKTAAAATTKPRLLYFTDDAFRCHFRKNFGQRLIAINGQIIVDSCRINHAVGAEHHTTLFFVERQVLFPEKGFFRFRMAIEQPAYNLSSAHGFGNDFWNIFNFH